MAVLEFELRKAYETIKSLRGSLTEAATGEYRKSENFRHKNIFVHLQKLILQKYMYTTCCINVNMVLRTGLFLINIQYVNRVVL